VRADRDIEGGEIGVSCDALVEAHIRLRHKERWDTFLAAL
jgi:hypothetical protein